MISPNKIPRPAFRDKETLDRHKRILLGLPVNKSRDRIPWGYIQDPKYKTNLLPNINALRLLYKAKEYLKTCSFLEVARWLSIETGASITHEGLRLILLDRFPFPEIMLPDDERERFYSTPTHYVADAKED